MKPILSREFRQAITRQEGRLPFCMANWTQILRNTAKAIDRRLLIDYAENSWKREAA
jgi:hypothetical protein